MTKTRFAKFPKLTNGNECDGSDVTRGTERVGTIYREIEWTRNAGMSERYTAKITGYRAERFADETEKTFATLAEARAWFRTA